VADREAKLTKARILLKSALKEEDYETAAVLRDQIAGLEAGPAEANQ
jgi:protein-arginine kinase activator protein McsA